MVLEMSLMSFKNSTQYRTSRLATESDGSNMISQKS